MPTVTFTLTAGQATLLNAAAQAVYGMNAKPALIEYAKSMVRDYRRSEALRQAKIDAEAEPDLVIT